MYRINVYNLQKKQLLSREVAEYPSLAQIDAAMAEVGGNGFVDICRSKDDGPLGHELGFTDDLQFDLVEGNNQYV